MSSMEAEYQTAIDEGRLYGAVLCARDATGKAVYEKAMGSRTLLSGEMKPMQTTDVLFMASATKLLTTIAALQCVDEGRLSLDGDVNGYLPEFKNKDVLVGFDEQGKPRYETAKLPVTLRQLLTHTSGWSYDEGIEEIERWREATGQSSAGKITVPDRFSWPLVSHPGEGWAYGPSLDWTGKLIERVAGKTLQARMEERMFAPLGIKDFSFFPVKHEQLRARMPDLNPEDKDGEGLRATAGYKLHSGSQGECFGGHGIYMTAPDYCAVLASILANDEKLLKAGTVEEMFVPQLNKQNRLYFDETMDGGANMFFAQGTAPGVMRDQGLGGLLVMEDQPGFYGAGTLAWGGALNTVWFIDRKNGLCGIGSPQFVSSPMHEEMAKLKMAFRKGMYEEHGR